MKKLIYILILSSLLFLSCNNLEEEDDRIEYTQYKTGTIDITIESPFDGSNDFSLEMPSIGTIDSFIGTIDF